MVQKSIYQKAGRARSERKKNVPRILLAEDHDEMRSLLVWALRKVGCAVTECADGATLCEYLSLPQSQFEGKAGHKYFDLIISDIRMPGVTGLEVLEGLRQSEEAFPPIILITSFGDEKTYSQARSLGAAAVFDKPFEIEDLLSKVREINQHQKPSRNRCFFTIQKGGDI